MKYFLILGSNPSISLGEFYSYFSKKGIDFSLEPINKEIAFFETDHSFDPLGLIKRLGGIIKIGVVEKEVKSLKAGDFVEILKEKNAKIEHKIKFGFSLYGKDHFPFNRLSMQIKNILKNENISSRWVTSKEKNLSSVVVEQNGLLKKGIEYLLVKHEEKYLLGHTLCVQDFKGLSRRDYGRPERDDVSGMLPPKLAQIMINISGVFQDDLLLDPFCGSGTVLSEAALMGVKNLYGSDLSSKAVSDTEANLRWIKKNNNIDFNLEIKKADASKLSTEFVGPKINFVVTEPYLGPQRGYHHIQKTVNELELMYSKTIKELSKITTKRATVVMVWPIFVSREGDKRKIFLDNINTFDFKIKNILPKHFLDFKFISQTRRGGLVYGRPGQKVWREIVLLEKND